MAQANSHPTTHSPVDSSRRRFMAVAAAASAVSAGTLAVAAMPPTAPAQKFYGAECPSYPNCTGGCGLGCTHEIEQAHDSALDAELVAAGAQFEALLTKWMPAWFEWARLHCDAQDEAEAKFGEQDGENEAWTKPLGTAPAFALKLEALERNGCNSAAAAETALFHQMRPLAEIIRESEARSLAGLRAKTLLSIWDFWPLGADDEDFSSELTETGHYSLFAASAAVTGLSGLIGDIEKRLASNNCQSLRDGAPLIA